MPLKSRTTPTSTSHPAPPSARLAPPPVGVCAVTGSPSLKPPNSPGTKSAGTGTGIGVPGAPAPGMKMNPPSLPPDPPRFDAPPVPLPLPPAGGADEGAAPSLLPHPSAQTDAAQRNTTTDERAMPTAEPSTN